MHVLSFSLAYDYFISPFSDPGLHILVRSLKQWCRGIMGVEWRKACGTWSVGRFTTATNPHSYPLPTLPGHQAWVQDGDISRIVSGDEVLHMSARAAPLMLTFWQWFWTHQSNVWTWYWHANSSLISFYEQIYRITFSMKDWGCSKGWAY